MSAPADPNQIPNGATEYVRASLRLGLTVPEIEKRLISQGVTPQMAAAVVNSVLDDHFHSRSGPREAGEWEEHIHRALSAATAIACVLLGYWYGEGLAAARTLILVLFPLACIWFPDHVTYLTGRTPEPYLRWGGWVALLVIGVYRWVLLIFVT